MVLLGNGDLLISDNTQGGLYLEHEGSLKRIDHGDFISPQTPAWESSSKRLVVPDYTRGLGVLDLSNGKVRWIQMDNHALEGIDGLYFHRNKLYAVQNGTSPGRVLAFTLNSDFSRVTSENIIESATPAIDPTHGVFVDNDFYYITNAGWDHLDDNGNVKAGETLTVKALPSSRWS